MAPFGIGANVVTFSVAAALLGTAALLGRRTSGSKTCPASTPSTGAEGVASLRLMGTLAWLIVALFTLAVELWEYAHGPRHLYPTLSSLANEVLGPGHRIARAVAFVCWGLIGLVIASPPRSRA